MSSEEDQIDQTRDRVNEILINRTLLITGGTGFVGKVLIEKILRVVHVKKIFVFIRTKKGKDPMERFVQIFNEPLFDLLKETRGAEILQKIHVIPADLSLPNLGLSADDRQLLIQEVEFIYHCAATIRFDEQLRPAVLLNVRGTKLMLELAKKCTKLMMFAHLSTAYCHLHERVIHEKEYPPPADPEAFIKTCEMMSNEALTAIAPKILENWPNSYAFTKCLSESLVARELRNGMPVVILRPSIIMPVLKEPLPGWTDNINGPVGLLIAAGKGVLRTMYIKGDAYADYVPVDIVANTILGCSVDHFVVDSDRRFYNITSSGEYKVTFEEIIEIGRKLIYTKIPLNGVFWYPGGSMKRSRLLHNIAFFFTQWLPAVVVDILLYCLGYEPILKRVQRRIVKGYEVFEYYANRQWDFDNEASMKARKLMTEREKELYKVDGDGVKYEDYFYNCILAGRRYVLKETDDEIPAAVRHMRVMYWVDRICKTLLICGFIYLVWRYIFCYIFNIV